MMRSWFGISIEDNTAVLLTIKFGLGFSQAVFCLLGLALCYPLLAERGAELGMANAHIVVLLATGGIGLVMFTPLALMFTGRSFVDAARLLARVIPPLRSGVERHSGRIADFDEACIAVLRNNRRRLWLVFGFLLAGWLVSCGETWAVLSALGIDADWRAIVVIEALGSLFRLVFFMVPSGVGGQDMSFKQLLALYRIPATAAGAFIILKRLKDILWIGVGFLLIIGFRLRPPRPTTPTETDAP